MKINGNIESHQDRVFRSYTGSGDLSYGGDCRIPCRFQISQFLDGRLIAQCNFDFEESLPLGMFESVKELTGTSEEGHKVRFWGNLLTTKERVKLLEREKARTLTIRGTQLQLDSFKSGMKPSLIAFSLANLSLHQDMSLDLSGFQVEVRRIAKYKEVLADLLAWRNVNVTAEARVRLTSENHCEQVKEIVTNLCLLLTLARGTRVEWLHYDLLSKEGERIRSLHVSPKITPFGILELIPLFPAQQLTNFVSTTFPRFKLLEKDWALTNAIYSYTDGKSEVDYLESRALKIVVTMELLKGRYLQMKAKERIIEAEEFGKIEKNLKRRIEQILRELLPGIEQGRLEIMTNHVAGMNRYPFARAVNGLTKELGLKLNSRDRRKFKEIRDHLVHSAAFHESHGSPSHQYFFVLTFVGKILLAILGYGGGFYYDWTEEHGREADSPMRKRLQLERSDSL